MDANIPIGTLSEEEIAHAAKTCWLDMEQSKQ
jgi:hypothetical protein